MESTERKKKTADALSDAKPGPDTKPAAKPGDTDGGMFPERRETRRPAGGAGVRVGLYIHSLYLPLVLLLMKSVGPGKVGRRPPSRVPRRGGLFLRRGHRMRRVINPERRRENGAAPGDGFWSGMMVLVFFMTTVSCKSLADHSRGKFPMETILGRRARLYSHV